MLSAALVRAFVGAGGTAVVPANAGMLRSAAFLDEVCGSRSAHRPTLAFAQKASNSGAHIMDVPAGVYSRVEVVTGLVSTGVSIVIAVTDAAVVSPPVAGSPVAPVLHIAVDNALEDPSRSVGDLYLGKRAGEEEPTQRLRWLQTAVAAIADALSLRLTPKSAEMPAFQIARGPTGVSA